MSVGGAVVILSTPAAGRGLEERRPAEEPNMGFVDSPLVTVLIPVYNREEYIARALDSALAQDFADYEIVVVDDGSTDRTAEIVKRYEHKVRYLRADHRGVAAARNLGFAEARGKYIAFLDSDDEVFPWWLRKTVALLARHPSAALCFGNLIRGQDSGGLFLGNWLPFDQGGHVVIEEPLNLLFEKRCFLSCLGTLAKRDLILRVGGMNEGLRVGVDYDLWFRLAPLGSFVGLLEPVGRIGLEPMNRLTRTRRRNPWFDFVVVEAAYAREVEGRGHRSSLGLTRVIESLLSTAAHHVRKGAFRDAIRVLMQYRRRLFQMTPGVALSVLYHAVQRLGKRLRAVIPTRSTTH